MNSETPAQMNKVILLARVSTREQGKSGLGLAAQISAMETFATRNNLQIVEQYEEIASGKVALTQRPVLLQALAHARKAKATLLTAYISRLSRNVEVISNLVNRQVDFCSVETGLDTTPFEIYLRSVFANEEARRISARTKAGLAEAKRRGVKLGNPTNLREAGEKGVSTIISKADEFAQRIWPVIRGLQADGHTTQKAIAEQLNILQVPTARGGRWANVQVGHIIRRIGRIQQTTTPAGTMATA